MRIRPAPYLLLGLTILSSFVLSAYAGDDSPDMPKLPPEHTWLSHGEFYLPEDESTPVRIFTLVVPSNIADPQFDPQQWLGILAQIREAAAIANASGHPERIQLTSIKKAVGISIEELNQEVIDAKRKYARRKNLPFDESSVTVTPQERLAFADSVIEFDVDYAKYPEVVQKNIARLRAALVDGHETFNHERVTLSDRYQNTKQYFKDITARPLDPEVLAKSRKLLGAYVLKQDATDGVVMAIYKGVVASALYSNLGLPPEIALGITTMQVLDTFFRRVYTRQYSAIFNHNTGYPGFRTSGRAVKWRRDLYYLLFNESVQFARVQGDWHDFGNAQGMVLFKNQVMGAIDRYWNSGLRDQVLGGSPAASRNFTRVETAATAITNGLEESQIFDHLGMDWMKYTIHWRDIIFYKITPSTAMMIGTYKGLSELLKRQPEIFFNMSNPAWKRQKLERIGSLPRRIWDRCRNFVGLPPKPPFDAASSPPKNGAGDDDNTAGR